MVNIEIDGIVLEVPQGSMVIEAADQAGIRIPRFCYHKKLSIAANCRMCLVEVEKAPKPLPACATPVTDGMKVFTKSEKALASQKNVMEFLLINHPLDCPICDQGGECELQDIAMGYGRDVSRFQEGKRVVKDKNIGPLIMTDMTRCIHCTRCVRFGQEIAGVREMGATGRGEHTVIGTYIEQSVDSEMSGNVIDLCPVGALTSKPFRFAARAWEMIQHDAIAPHDCIGSNVHIHTHLREGRVMRVVPKANDAINESWIADRDRFSYAGLYSEDRLHSPMIKSNGKWEQTDWNTALEYAVAGLQKIADGAGAEQIGALISPACTTEEMYLTQKLMRGLGCNNIDHRLRQNDFSDQDKAPVFPWLGQSVEDLENINAALLIGSNVRKEQPIAAHRLRKAVSWNDARLMFINPVDYDFHFDVAAKDITSPVGMLHSLAGVLKALLEITDASTPAGADALLSSVSINDAQRRIAEQLNSAEKTTVLLGAQALSHPQLAVLRMLASEVARLSNASFGYLPEAANSVGACLAGATPHRIVGGKSANASGMHVRAMIEEPRRAYMLVGVEPELDSGDQAGALVAMKAADFVVALSPFISDSMKEYADVILSTASFGETSGTYVNAEGNWQSFKGSVEPVGKARPAWKVLRVLGNLFEQEGFEYFSSEDVLDELRAQLDDVQADNMPAWQCPRSLGSEGADPVRIAEVPMYAIDGLVRRSAPLQQTVDAHECAIYLNAGMAEKLGLEGKSMARARQTNGEVTLPLEIDNRVADNCVLIPAGLPVTVGLGMMGAPVTLEKV